MPPNTFSFYTQISENALYYLDSKQIDGKTLFVEDLEWTNQMLMFSSGIGTTITLSSCQVTRVV